MGFIILTSDNKDLSYVIKKNPSTSPHIKPIRKGVAMGWFDKNSYIMRFVDIYDHVSFPKNKYDKYDYLSYMQYCAPIVLTCVVKEMLGTALNQSDALDQPSFCRIEQPLIKLSTRALNLIDKLNNFVKKFKIDITSTNCADLYDFSVMSHSSSISELLQYSYFLGFTLNCLTFGYDEQPCKDALNKIIKIINNLNMPYYIRYLYKNHMIKKEDFYRIKKELEGSENVTMVYGNTQMQRFDHISDHVIEFCNTTKKIEGMKVHIVDIGCGEGYYVRNLLKLLKKKNINIEYHAHDVDPEEMKKINTLIKNDELYHSVKPYNTIDQLIEGIRQLSDQNNKIMIIFTEVIEHISLQEVKEFMIKILQGIPFNKMLITTPQYEFNKYYSIETIKFRHPDHKQEFTKQQFMDFIKICTISSGKNIICKYEMIGDQIDNISVSQGVCLSV